MSLKKKTGGERGEVWACQVWLERLECGPEWGAGRGQRPAWGEGATGRRGHCFLPGANGTLGKGKARRRPGAYEGPVLLEAE